MSAWRNFDHSDEGLKRAERELEHLPPGAVVTAPTALSYVCALRSARRRADDLAGRLAVIKGARFPTTGPRPRIEASHRHDLNGGWWACIVIDTERGRDLRHFYDA